MTSINAWFYRQIAHWAMIFNQHEIAAEYWLRVAALKPNDPKPLTVAAHCMALLHRNLEAEALLRKSVESDPGYAPAWFNLGFLIQKREDHEEALRCFDMALRFEEKMDRAHYGRALSLIALNRPEEAKASLQRTIDLQPMSPYGYYQLASLHHKLGDEKACIKLVKKLHQFEPQLAVQLQNETGVSAGVEDPFAKYRQ
jgi:tetratricopeptide (TPR) repeat protein